MMADEQPKQLGGSVRQADFCISFGFPNSQCCSGCVSFADSIGIPIDSRDTLLLLAMNTKLSNQATVLFETKKKLFSKKYMSTATERV
jgi:hypothetical protein